MSRSRRHTTIVGNTTSKSEAFDKRVANRVLRMQVKQALLKETEVLPNLREVSDIWSWKKDGKHFVNATDFFYSKAKRK